MNIRTSLCLICLMATSLLANSQEYNVVDNNGLRQGKWHGFYDNGQLRYQGQFKDGNGVGVFEYYDEQGNLKATNTFEKRSNKVLNQTFATNGTKIASGYYVEQKRSGEWQFFNETDGKLIRTETYVDGKITGVAKGYKDGNVVEEIEYVNGVKNGKYNTYYDNGSPLSVGTYKDGSLSGLFTAYYPNGKVQFQGEYSYGVRMGIWRTYDDEGNEVSSDKHNIVNYNDPTLEALSPDE